MPSSHRESRIGFPIDRLPMVKSISSIQSANCERSTQLSQFLESDSATGIRNAFSTPHVKSDASNAIGVTRECHGDADRESSSVFPREAWQVAGRLRLAQKFEDSLRRLVGNGQDRDAGLFQDLGPCHVGRFLGEVRVLNIAL